MVDQQPPRCLEPLSEALRRILSLQFGGIGMRQRRRVGAPTIFEEAARRGQRAPAGLAANG
jgi:hypothetical protein